MHVLPPPDEVWLPPLRLRLGAYLEFSHRISQGLQELERLHGTRRRDDPAKGRMQDFRRRPK